MNDEKPTPFQFNPPTTDAPHTASDPNSPSPRKRGKRNKPASGGRGRPPATVKTEPAPARPPKAAKRAKKVREAKIPLALALSACGGLREEDAKFLIGVVQAMQAFTAEQRRRIAGALGKLVGAD